ncbi:hypothetical protein TNIN_8551 [Trichonephila inaurata madagascariensis]|uniref:Uncharacterized protein n=1 Tax=Trichonephila inaurata madagascariensis TaxID=2747483 RepID=A0A8X6XCI7_9ARAC|nr:hypothetical protein TNIN_8551 [Trichonephila inaurata madagascariensis]
MYSIHDLFKHIYSIFLCLNIFRELFGLNKEKRGFPVCQPKQESIEDRFGDIALVNESSAKNVLKYNFPQARSQYGVDHASRTAAMV